MIAYLLQMAICHGLLWGFYRLWLEHEAGHRFKRIYLLVAISVGLIAPWLPFSLSLPIDPILANSVPAHFAPAYEILPLDPQTTPAPSPISFNQPADSPAPWAWAYVLISGYLLFRWLRKGWQLIRRVQNSPQVALPGKMRLVLLPEKVAPHSFGRWVFVSQSDYEAGTIPEAILAHEGAHLRQKHSWDLIGFELLACLFWANPAWLLYRRAIRLNHEFLADQAALPCSPSVQAYQRVLLAQIEHQRAQAWASSSTYHLTRKRLIMMTKTSPSKLFFIKQLLCIPILVALSTFSMLRLSAQEAPRFSPDLVSDTNLAPGTAPSDTVVFDSLEKLKAYANRYASTILRDGNGAFCRDEHGKYIRCPYRFMSPAVLKVHLRYALPPLKPHRNPPFEAQLQAFLNPNEYGVWIDQKRIPNEALRNYQASDFAVFFQSRLLKNAAHYGQYTYHLSLITEAAYRQRLAEYTATVEAAQGNWMEDWWQKAEEEKEALRQGAGE